MTEDERAEAIAVPYTALQPATLRAVIEEFVTRDTTDYSERARAGGEGRGRHAAAAARPGAGGIRSGDGHGEHRASA